MATARELRRELDQKRGELNEWLQGRTNAHGQLDFSVAELKSFNDRNDELGPLQDSWAAAVKAEEAAKSLREVDRRGLFGNTSTDSPGAFAFQGGQAPVKTLGQMFVESEAYKAHKSETGSESTSPGNRFQVELKGITLTDLFMANAQRGFDTSGSATKATVTSSMGVVPYPVQQSGFVAYGTRRPVVPDLIPQAPTDSPIVLYVEETGVNHTAAPVAEGALKPQSDFTTERRTVNVEVIAHRFKLTNQALEDIPGLRDRLDVNGTLGLALAEEMQILTGNGTSPQLQGFLTKSGVQTQAVGADDRFTAFRKAMTNVQAVGFANVSGAVLNTYDWQEFLTTKDANGRFIFGDPGAATQETRLWGVPVVGTVAMTQGTALLGDFLMYSRLWRKGGVRVIVGYSSDDIDRNLQTFVIEERVALEIDRASAFCKITGLTLS